MLIHWWKWKPFYRQLIETILSHASKWTQPYELCGPPAGPGKSAPLCDTIPQLTGVPTLTSWPASSGIYSMMASRTLHLASSASSTMAGRSDWESCRIPITSFTQSKLEMIFKRTSGHCKYTSPKRAHIKIKFSARYSPTTMISK